MESFFYGNNGTFYFQDLYNQKNKKYDYSFYQGLTQLRNGSLFKSLNKIKLNTELFFYIEFYNGYLKVGSYSDFEKIFNFFKKTKTIFDLKDQKIFLPQYVSYETQDDILKKIKGKYLLFYFDKQVRIFYDVDEMILNFDMKPIYDFSSFGKNYNVNILKKDHFDKNYLRYKYKSEVQFKNSSTNYEDSMAIISSEKPQVLNDWVKEFYMIESRRSKSDSMKSAYTRDLLKFEGKGSVVILTQLNNSLQSIKLFDEEYLINNSLRWRRDNSYVKRMFVLNNIKKLYDDSKNDFFAGFPWFFQHWSRDSLISFYYLRNVLNPDVYDAFIKAQLDKLETVGIFPNMNSEETVLMAMDSAFWLFKNCIELIDRFDKDKVLSIMSKFVYDLKKSQKNTMIFCKSKETWMDTEFNDNGRAGYPIEIQLGYKMILNYLLSNKIENIGNKIEVKKELKKLNKEIHKFIKKDVIFDVLNTNLKNENNIRSNIFIGSVFSNSFFESYLTKIYNLTLNHLFCDSGISSISKKSSLFEPVYSGENNKSYHRGDSWMFLNNITANLFQKTDPKMFSQFIGHIWSVNDFLCYQGVYGALNEVSSANFLSVDGCPVQLWSMATLFD